MPNALPSLNLSKEAEAIVAFLNEAFRRSGKNQAVIGWSGGIDSTVSLFLLSKALSVQNIHVFHLPYSRSYMDEFKDVQNMLQLPAANIKELSIRKIVDTIGEEVKAGTNNVDKIRIGNIMARTRMIILFDQAKAIDGLVCGTENKTEHLLGYFTRYGDGASDIEPIVNLYKTQVYALAKYLGVPEIFIKKAPTAGLWNGQTDESEFGFTYTEADMVCCLYYDHREPIDAIVKKGFPNARQIISFAEKNRFKRIAPYTRI